MEERSAGSSFFGNPTARRWSRVSSQQSTRSARDHQVHGLRALALLVRLDVERDALTFVERFLPGVFHRRDVHEHVASAIVRLDEAVAALAVEELDHSTLRHREAPFPNCFATGPHGAAARPDIPGKSVGTPSHFRQPPEGGGTSKPARESRQQPGPAGKRRAAAPVLFFAGQPADPRLASARSTSQHIGEGGQKNAKLAFKPPRRVSQNEPTAAQTLFAFCWQCEFRTEHARDAEPGEAAGETPALMRVFNGIPRGQGAGRPFSMAPPKTLPRAAGPFR